MQKNISFKRGKLKREELELPTLHFVVMDQWIDVIGEKALFSWLKFYTWCKRDDEDSEFNLWEQAKIPTSYNKVIKRLGVGKDTFYNKILKPLWNVGLIDIEEYEESEVKGNKPMNIIVYKYPQNNKSLAHEEIKMIRDFDKDYHSNAKTFAKKGGRPKNINGEKDKKKGGSEIEPPMVLKQNHPWFQNRTTPGSEIEPNNILNSFSNSFNSLINILNSSNNNLNLSNDKSDRRSIILEQLWNLKIPKELKIKIKVLLQKNLINLSSEQLYEIEEAYDYHVRKLNVIPNTDSTNTYALNDSQFSSSISKMLETVKKIDSMKAIIDKYVKNAIEYKHSQLTETDYSNTIDKNSKSYETISIFKEILGD